MGLSAGIEAGICSKSVRTSAEMTASQALLSQGCRVFEPYGLALRQAVWKILSYPLLLE